MPAEKPEPLCAPPAPEIEVGPDAVSVKSEAAAVPPSSFTTCLTSVNDGALSLFVIVQVTSSPIASVILSGPLNEPPPVQTQLDASYVDGPPDSARVYCTPGVTSFVGHGNRPTPLDDTEVKAILKQMEEEAPKVRVSYQVGQAVKITDGPFTDFEGIVDAIDHERGRVRVLVSFFGREAPVELDFLQVTRLVD